MKGLKCVMCDGKGFKFAFLRFTKEGGVERNPHPVETCWWCKGEGYIKNWLKQIGVN